MVSRFILAISTSSGVAKVAAATEPLELNAHAADLFNFEITDYKSQSAQLLPLIQQHLELGNLKPAQCAAIAVDIGPGGFTSLRTACGIAQGLAVAWQVPTVPLSSFECLLPAWQQELPVTVLMDARLHEIYAACIQRTAQGTAWVKPPHLLAMHELQKFRGRLCAMHICMRSYTTQAQTCCWGPCAQFAWHNWHGKNSWQVEWLHRLIVSLCMFATRSPKPPLNDWR